MGRRRKYKKSNPVSEFPDVEGIVKRFRFGSQAGVLIYPVVLHVVAKKADGKAYKHKFYTETQLWGLEDGNLLIVSPYKLHLWAKFPTSVKDLKKHEGERIIKSPVEEESEE